MLTGWQIPKHPANRGVADDYRLPGDIALIFYSDMELAYEYKVFLII